MDRIHHRKLPDFSTFLSGYHPRDAVGFTSDRLQIWYNNTDRPWRDDRPHAHQHSDEIFIVLKGALVVEVARERITVGAGEFCCFPSGVFHAVVNVQTPAETLMIRSPSVDDKIFPVEKDV